MSRFRLLLVALVVPSVFGCAATVGPAGSSGPTPLGVTTPLPTSAVTPTVAAPTATPPGDAGLLSHIPAAIAATCDSMLVAYPNSVEGVECHPTSGATVAAYIQFADTASMDAVFDDQWQTKASGAVDGGRCEGGASGVGPVTFDDGTNGRYLCYPSDVLSAQWLYWTHEATNILAYAALDGAAIGPLFEWWETAGPMLGTAPTGTPRAATPAPGPSATPVGAQLGTGVLLFIDEFDDPDSGWAIGAVLGATVAYETGALAMDITSLDSGHLRTPRHLASSFNAVRFAAVYEIESGSAGIYGAHCIDADGDWFGGAVVTDGSYMLYRRVAGVDEVLQHETTVPLPDTGPGGTVGVMIECAVTPAGDAEVYFSANGVLLFHQTETQTALGPLTAVGLYTESAAGSPLKVNVLESAAWVAALGTEPVETAAAGILAHIPADLRATCQPWDAEYENVIEAVQCVPTSGADSVGYALFPDRDATNYAFSYFDGGDDEIAMHNCSDGQSGTGTYDIVGEAAGDYLCYIQADTGVGYVIWTRWNLNILAYVARNDADFDALWDWWVDAGPN